MLTAVATYVTENTSSQNIVGTLLMILGILALLFFFVVAPIKRAQRNHHIDTYGEDPLQEEEEEQKQMAVKPPSGSIDDGEGHIFHVTFWTFMGWWYAVDKGRHFLTAAYHNGRYHNEIRQSFIDFITTKTIIPIVPPAAESEDSRKRVVTLDNNTHVKETLLLSAHNGHLSDTWSEGSDNKGEHVQALSGLSYNLPGLLKQSERTYLVAIEGFLVRIHNLYIHNGRRIVHDGFVTLTDDDEDLKLIKMTQVEWDYLIGPPQETRTKKPGLLRKARVICTEESEGKFISVWPYETAQAAYRQLQPWLFDHLLEQRRKKKEGALLS